MSLVKVGNDFFNEAKGYIEIVKDSELYSKSELFLGEWNYCRIYKDSVSNIFIELNEKAHKLKESGSYEDRQKHDYLYQSLKCLLMEENDFVDILELFINLEPNNELIIKIGLAGELFYILEEIKRTKDTNFILGYQGENGRDTNFDFKNKRDLIDIKSTIINKVDSSFNFSGSQIKDYDCENIMVKTIFLEISLNGYTISELKEQIKGLIRLYGNEKIVYHFKNIIEKYSNLKDDIKFNLKEIETFYFKSNGVNHLVPKIEQGPGEIEKYKITYTNLKKYF